MPGPTSKERIRDAALPIAGRGQVGHAHRPSQVQEHPGPLAVSQQDPFGQGGDRAALSAPGEVASGEGVDHVGVGQLGEPGGVAEAQVAARNRCPAAPQARIVDAHGQRLGAAAPGSAVSRCLTTRASASARPGTEAGVRPATSESAGCSPRRGQLAKQLGRLVRDGRRRHVGDLGRIRVRCPLAATRRGGARSQSEETRTPIVVHRRGVAGRALPGRIVEVSPWSSSGASRDHPHFGDSGRVTPAMNSSKIRRSRAEAESLSGWNWVPKANQSSIVALDGLDDAVGASGRDGEARGHFVDRHVVHAVDADLAFAVDALHQRAGLDLQGVAMGRIHAGPGGAAPRGMSSGMCRNRLPPCETFSNCMPTPMPNTGMRRSATRRISMRSNFSRRGRAIGPTGGA